MPIHGRRVLFQLGLAVLFIVLPPVFSSEPGVVAGLFSPVLQASALTIADKREPIDAVNNPARIYGAVGSIERRLSALPLTGSSSKPIWTGSWWPLSAGGTAARPSSGSLSPLEKLDAVTNRRNLATNWELDHARRHGTVSWAGHCNGLAAAGIMEVKPRHAVRYRNVIFTTSDIQALLIELWQGSGRIVGGRCERSTFSMDDTGRISDPECRDLNPGSLHLALTNFLGRWKIGLIVDTSLQNEVWNYPVSSYSSTVTTLANAREAARLVGGRNNASYQWNPAAVSFAQVTMRINLATSVRSTYNYLLEMDRNGNILGGEWLGDSRYYHPDFVWRPDVITLANPYIDIPTVREIARLSQMTPR